VVFFFAVTHILSNSSCPSNPPNPVDYITSPSRPPTPRRGPAATPMDHPGAVWWKCAAGPHHEWEASPADRAARGGRLLEGRARPWGGAVRAILKDEPTLGGGGGLLFSE